MTTLEAPKNPIVKPVIKPEQNIETVKKPAVTSEKPKTVERSHSQGSNNHNSNKESFNQKTEKNISSQNYHSGFTDEINSTAFTADRNISASKISNNGFDHVFRNKNTGEVWIVDSKQIAKTGNMKVSNKGVGGTRQMSPDWVKNVSKKLGKEHPLTKEIEKAKNTKKLKTGLVGVDKDNEELIFIPVEVQNK